MDEDSYDFQEFLTYKLKEAKFAPFPDDSPPKPYEINFRFSLIMQISERIILHEDDDDPQHMTPFSFPVDDYLARFSGHQFSSFEETHEYMEEQLRALPVSTDERRKLVDHALETASNIIMFDHTRGGAPRLLNLHFSVLLDHVYTYEYSSSFCMTPASDSSIEVLKAVEYSRRNMETSCSICLENVFSGDGDGDGGDCDKEEALSMPCSHIFHGDCIKKWLMTSHYCPLCRFEMPTGELDI